MKNYLQNGHIVRVTTPAGGIASGAGELYLWVDNLQDKRYDQYVYYFTPNANVGMPTRGRTVGLGFTWQFF